MSSNRTFQPRQNAAGFWFCMVAALSLSIRAFGVPADNQWQWGLRHGGIALGAATEKQTYLVGEPVLLWMRFTNSLDLRVTLSGENSRRGLKIVVIGEGKIALIPTNPWIAYQEQHGKPHPSDPIFSEESIDSRPPGLAFMLPRGFHDSEVDIAKEFDLSKPGQYLIYVSRTPWTLTTEDGNSPRKYFNKPGEYRSGNVIINILAAAPGSPNDASKPNMPAGQTNAAPGKSKYTPGQSPSPGAGSVTNQSKSATPGAGGSVVSGASDTTAQKGGPQSAASGTGGPSPRATPVSRTSITAFLFALLGFGVLWWMSRGK